MYWIAPAYHVAPCISASPKEGSQGQCRLVPGLRLDRNRGRGVDCLSDRRQPGNPRPEIWRESFVAEMTPDSSLPPTLDSIATYA